MKRYFGYIRVSTPRQGQGVSLQEQQSAIAAHASRNGMTIVEWFEEKETAAKEGRNIFSTLLRKLEEGKAEGVIIHKIDRSARNLWDWANLSKLFDRGIDVQFAHDSIDLKSRGGRLSADIMAVVAADYVRNLREEVRKGIVGRFKQGLYPLPAPIGYLDCGGGKPKIIDPTKGPLIRWAFERYATGAVSLEGLARELSARGLVARHGGILKVSPLAATLKNPFYVGLVRIASTGEVFQGIHEPLVRQAIFDQVQDVLAGRLRRKTATHEFAYRQFARCAKCNRYLTGERKKGQYLYYRCYNPACRGTVCREADINLAVLEAATRCRLRPEDLEDLRDIARRYTQDEKSDAGRQSKHHEMLLTKLDERLERLTDALVDGLLDKVDYDLRRLSLLKERRNLQDREEIEASATKPGDRVHEWLELQNVVQLSLISADGDQISKLARTLSWNCTLHSKNLVITLRNPFFEIQNWNSLRSVDHLVERQELSVEDLFKALLKAAEEEPWASPPSPNVPPVRPTRGRPFKARVTKDETDGYGSSLS